MRRVIARNNSRDACETRKVRYRDQGSARRAVAEIAGRSRRDRVPVRFYECNLCRGWHVTSQADRNAQ